MKLPKIAITHGDPNGIGYEVILKCLEDTRMTELCIPIIYGSAKIAAHYRKLMDLPAVQLNHIKSAEDAQEGCVNIINVLPEDWKVDPGECTEWGGRGAFMALESAVSDMRNGLVDALVTAPVNKAAIQSDTFSFPGHTEYLEASLAAEGEQALMVLCAGDVRVALVTTHIPVSAIAQALTSENIVKKLEVFSHALHRDFRIHHPRIAVLGLNPHAGDGGLLGREEQEIIIPAIEEAQQKKIQAFGPYAADGFFGAGHYKKFDGILAMYHDQGLAPFKTLAMEAGVNFTAGLGDYVRTSPDHGTGFDIAGQGVADESSLRQAIYTAIDILRNRRSEDVAHRHPLRKQYYEKGSDNVVLDLS
ncbi:MAG: 4-hydroxythreonine-4-phosphate dehydrogenase PdxA [Muribaculaceae bacterium]|nr:4-hydroxythreonine-4-phosphate dehydrogenase PdxA [Muribaculaceae bacterium]